MQKQFTAARAHTREQILAVLPVRDAFMQRMSMTLLTSIYAGRIPTIVRTDVVQHPHAEASVRP